MASCSRLVSRDFRAVAALSGQRLCFFGVNPKGLLHLIFSVDMNWRDNTN